MSTFHKYEIHTSYKFKSEAVIGHYVLWIEKLCGAFNFLIVRFCDFSTAALTYHPFFSYSLLGVELIDWLCAFKSFLTLTDHTDNFLQDDLSLACYFRCNVTEYTHFAAGHPLLLCPSSFPCIKLFSIELGLCITWSRIIWTKHSIDSHVGVFFHPKLHLLYSATQSTNIQWTFFFIFLSFFLVTYSLTEKEPSGLHSSIVLHFPHAALCCCLYPFNHYSAKPTFNKRNPLWVFAKFTLLEGNNNGIFFNRHAQLHPSHTM